MRSPIGRAARATVLLVAASLWAASVRPARAEEHWQLNDPASTLTVDHRPWTAFLGHYLVPRDDGINRVDYGHVSPGDRAALASYIASLEAVPVTRLKRAEQLAYWVNLYNAETVRFILDHYPVGSIRDISTGFFSIGPWGGTYLTIEGMQVSLDDIENEILRPIWRDPRVHYALNCASLGCPNLQPMAFTAANADELLERGAKAYVNHPRGAMISYGRLIVSSIYRWYKKDFGGTDAGVIAHLKHYAAPQLAAELDHVTEIYDNHYDWRLNDVRN
jgi:hypothetical protein